MNNILADKAMDFSVMIVNEQKRVAKEMHEYHMSDQLKRAATSIGALYSEAEFAESASDFVHKLRIALKEANESKYWLELLQRTDYISLENFNSYMLSLTELKRMLISSINTTLRRMDDDKKSNHYLPGILISYEFY